MFWEQVIDLPPQTLAWTMAEVLTCSSVFFSAMIVLRVTVDVYEILLKVFRGLSCDRLLYC